MEDLFNQVKLQLNEWPEWKRSRRVMLAVSGGMDSMVLLSLIIKYNKQLEEKDRKKLIVAHFDHQLREDSYLDAILVKDFAQEHGLLYFVDHWDEPAKTNVEANARDARYMFFADVMDATESDTLLTAHHLNDLGETVLMRLARGTSLRGVRGIRSNYRRLLLTSQRKTISMRVLRPLISITKEELRQYAQKHEIPYNEDMTNHEMTYMRNRIRHQFVPLFEEENPQFLKNLMALTEQLEASYDAHYSQYLQIEPELVMQLRQGRWLLFVPNFFKLSKDLIQIYLAIFLEERLIHQVQSYSKVAVRQLERLITQTESPNMRIDIANSWVARREYDYVWIEPQDFEGENGEWQVESPVKLERINHWYKLSHNESIGLFEVGAIATDLRRDNYEEIPMILKEGESLPIIRHRQEGDTLRLRRFDGTPYHKKISRILIDNKIPKSMRDEFWLAESCEGKLLAMFPHISKDEIFYDQLENATHLLIYQKNKNKP
ncbi:tRNA lysidine(34) synthetase TilS [Aerococcaceae bacterium WGS1372]